MSARYTCPCCGYQTLTSRPGNYDICHVCFWEDDSVQLLDPWFPGGANKVSLVEAQRNYAQHGVSELRFKSNVKGLLPGDTRDPTWRPVQPLRSAVRSRPGDPTDEEWKDAVAIYYWARHRLAAGSRRHKRFKEQTPQ